MVDRPQPALTQETAPVAFALRNTADRKARGRLRAAATAEAIGRELEWLDAEGWRYQLEAPPRVTISPKDNERAAATVDLRVWDASNTLIFRDRIHAWDGFPVLVPDGTEHEEDDGRGGKVRVSNFREAPLEAARSDLAHTVRVVTKNGPWVKDTPGTVSTFYGATADASVESSSSSYATARSGGGTLTTSSASASTHDVLWQLGSTYYISELFLAFDTSALPDGDAASVATISLYCNGFFSWTWTNAYIRQYGWGASVDTGDYRATDGTSASDTLLATKAASAFAATQYVDFVSEPALSAAIDPTGTLYCYALISNAEAATAPESFGGDYFNISSANASGTTQDPKLVVTHAPANTAPTITSQPSTTYASRTRTGPANTWGVTFTATDAEQTGANALSYQIRTSATPGGGSLVSSGSCTSGVSKAITGLAYNATGMVQGSNTLYVHVSDGTETVVSNSFTVLRDDSVSVPTNVVDSPDPTPDKQYSVSFDAPDTYSTGTNEMTWQIRTATGGGGSLVASGNFTQGTGKSTGTVNDSGLGDGANNRWLRIIDGAANAAETQYTISTSIVKNITGVVAALSAAGLAGTVASQEVETIIGVPATVGLDAPVGSITAQMAATVTGAFAALGLDALAGSVAAVRVVTVSGTTATLTLSAPVGIVEALRILERALTHFRFRNDDGSEATATWAAAEDTDIIRAKNITARLRIQVDTNYAEPAAEGMKLQYRKVGDPDWVDIPTA